MQGKSSVITNSFTIIINIYEYKKSQVDHYRSIDAKLFRDLVDG